MKNLIIVFSYIFLLTPIMGHGQSADDWVQIFDGKSLKGWDVKITGHDLNDNYANTFRVDDGVLKASYDEYEDFDGTFGHLFYNQKYSYYKLRVTYRFVGEQVEGGPGWAFRNNGLMLHSQSANSMLKDQNFPISIEAQLLGGSGEGERTTANLCTPGTNVVMDGKLVTQHCINSTSKTYHGDVWVDAEFVVLGEEQVIHIVEEDTVLVYEKPQIGGGSVDNFAQELKVDGKLLNEGYIAIQAESHPTEFRKIEVLELVGCMDPKAKNYRSYFVKGDDSCEY
jgi:hypothetical protein